MPGLVYVEDDEEGGPGHWRWSEGNHSLLDEEKSENAQEEGEIEKGDTANAAANAAFAELPSVRSFRTGPRGESSPSFASSVLQRSKTTPSAGSQLERKASKGQGTNSPTLARAKSNKRSKPEEKPSQENSEKDKYVRVGSEIVRADSIRHLEDAFEEMDVDGAGSVDKMNFMDFISHHRDIFGWLGEESSDINEAIAKWVDSIFQRQGMSMFTFKDVLRVLYPSAKNADIDRLEQLVDPPGRASASSASLSNAEEQDIEAVSLSSLTCFTVMMTSARKTLVACRRYSAQSMMTGTGSWTSLSSGSSCGGSGSRIRRRATKFSRRSIGIAAVPSTSMS